MYFSLVCQFLPSRDAPGSSFIWCLLGLESAWVIFSLENTTMPTASFKPPFRRLLWRMVYSKSNFTPPIPLKMSQPLTICTADPLWAGFCDFLWKKEVSLRKAIDKAFRQVAVSDRLKDRRNLLLYCNTPSPPPLQGLKFSFRDARGNCAI